MKMLKKLLAVVLTGAMALTLLTACGGNAVNDKNIADAMTDVAKYNDMNITFTPRAEEREMARKLAALLDGKTEYDASKTEVENEIAKILGYNEGGPNEESRFVWYGRVFTDEIGVTGQVYQLVDYFLNPSGAVNYDKVHNKNNQEPAGTHYMGTAFCKMPGDNGELLTMRVILVTADAEDPQHPRKA